MLQYAIIGYLFYQTYKWSNEPDAAQPDLYGCSPIAQATPAETPAAEVAPAAEAPPTEGAPAAPFEPQMVPIAQVAAEPVPAPIEQVQVPQQAIDAPPA